MSQPAIVWFQLDLRLEGNPALARALESGRPVIPVYIYAPDEENSWPPGAASRWWLHHSLQSLQSALVSRGSRLILRHGPSAKVLAALAEETGARHVFWNRRYEPAVAARDRVVERSLRDSGIAAVSCPGNLLFEPGTVLNKSGRPFRVFTPFWRACQTRLEAQSEFGKPRPVPERLPSPSAWPRSRDLSSFGLLPTIDWAAGLRESWHPGEPGALRQIRRFLQGGIDPYAVRRDRPDPIGTSQISPHLHFGEIGVHEIYRLARHSENPNRAEPYLRQIAWREFSYHLLHRFPQTARQPLRPEFEHFGWLRNAKARNAWTRGRTGYPMVDAGMRQLWHTGWMHNRVRMLAASFLVKHLLIPWQEGAKWFWDALVDADLANNTTGWQWVAGCGADAAPYFRIFNPVLQGKKFDPDGDYIRRWIPELARLPRHWIHKPWQAPVSVLAEAGVELGSDYPLPIVDHEVARKRALAAFEEMKRESRRSNPDILRAR